MPKKTIRTGLRSILREEHRDQLLPVFRELAVAASFLRRQASLLLNVYLQHDDAVLPATEQMQAYFEFAQGLFQSNFHPTIITPEKAALREEFTTNFQQFFTGQEGISRPSIFSAQIRSYNARTMLANFKAHMYTHFHKFQYQTIKAQVAQYVPTDLETRPRQAIINKMSVYIASQVNHLIFVQDSGPYLIAASNSNGTLTDNMWDQLTTTSDQDDDSSTDSNSMQQDEDDLEQDDSNSESDEYDDENADSDSDSDASDDVDPGTGSQGERFVRMYIPEQARTSMIDSHRRAMGVLLVEDAGATHNFRRLTRRALKERQLLSSIFCYFRYLRGIRSTLDVRRFHLFPEYSMVVKHFHIDERILEQMCNLESDQPKPWTLRRLRRPPMPNAGPNTSIWDQIFDLEHLRRK
jgi:hypothetical protein